MNPRITLVTNGNPLGSALWHWLDDRDVPARLVELPLETDLESARAEREDQHTPERIVALDSTNAALLDVLRKWTAPLGPMEIRTRGAEVIEERRRAGAEGHQVLDQWLWSLRPGAKKVARRASRGRPPTSNPYSGVGFEVCVELLLDPAAKWNQRTMGERVGHASSAVHRVFVQLEERGFLRRARGAVTARNVIALRDEFGEAWRARVGSPRAALPFIADDARDLEKRVFDAARRADIDCLVAGPNAVRGPERFVGGPLTVYFGADPTAALAAEGLQRSARSGDVMVWVAPEEGVFLHPRELGGLRATNRVVTWLDLMAAGTDRHKAAADAVWAEPA